MDYYGFREVQRDSHKNKQLEIKSFAEIISPANLFSAWRDFKVGKKNKRDVAEFELNLEDNMFQLHDDLRNGLYRHSDYSSFFVRDPKLRLIHKAAVCDRVLHHALTRALEPVFEKIFIFDSYSSRKNKGTHRAIARFRCLAWRLSANNTKTVWILKGDIRKYFASVNQEILFALLKKKINDEQLLRLIREIIFSHHNPAGQGIPLGNLTSQLFSNIYLNELDEYVKRKLGVKNYVRYADDFVIMSRDLNELKRWLDQINEFLKIQLQLETHPAKTGFRRWHQGLDFLGYIIFPHYVILRAKTRKRMFKKMKAKQAEYLAGKINLKSLSQTRQSYLGLLSHACGRVVAIHLP